MPNGGTVLSNLITLCPECHGTAEDIHNSESMFDPDVSMASCVDGDILTKDDINRFTRSKLYELIGSSYDQAMKDSEAL
jgi:hypothetical protein